MGAKPSGRRLTRAWLGHESIETTHIYMESNLAHKEEALGRLQPAGQRTPRFHATDKVMAFLETL